MWTVKEQISSIPHLIILLQKVMGDQFIFQILEPLLHIPISLMLALILVEQSLLMV